MENKEEFIEVDFNPERRKVANGIVENIKEIWLKYAYEFDDKKSREMIIGELENLLIPKNIGVSIFSDDNDCSRTVSTYSNNSMYSNLKFITSLKIKYRDEYYPINDLINFCVLKWVQIK